MAKNTNKSSINKKTKKKSSKAYRKNVGIIVFNNKGEILIGQRYDYPKYYQFPQGGIDKNESPLEAAHRELKEETGISLIGEAIYVTKSWLYYDFPNPSSSFINRLQDYQGQMQKWFLFSYDNSSLNSTDESIDEFIDKLKLNNTGDTLLNLNIQSLPSKYEDMKIMLHRINNETNRDISFINLQETWLNEFNKTLIHFPNYNIEYKNRINKRGGGLAMLIKENIKYSVRSDLSSTEDKQQLYDCLFIEVNQPNKQKLILGNIYRNPGATNTCNFIKDLEILLEKIKKDKTSIIISGDFNINLFTVTGIQTSTINDKQINN